LATRGKPITGKHKIKRKHKEQKTRKIQVKRLSNVKVKTVPLHAMEALMGEEV
jgi:hypothetical protein